MALPTQMKLLKTQAFTIALIAACGVAWIVPDAGAPGGILKSEFTTKIAVVIAFFLQGLNIRARQLLGSISKGRVLLFCQIWNFAIAPTIMLAIVFVADRWIHPGVRDGLLYLSILPTTISSSIVLTGSYSGDTATSLLNATLSNLLGVFVTPLWCIILFSHATSQFPPMAALISKIALLIILPIGVAQILRPYLKAQIEKQQPFIKHTSNAMIVFIVYASFSSSVANGLWQTLPGTALVAAFVLSFLFLLITSTLVWRTSLLADQQTDQRIAAFFCGSQKTLAAGAPMAAIIFANQNSAEHALLILPLILYHSLQLFLAGIVGPRLAKPNRG